MRGLLAASIVMMAAAAAVPRRAGDGAPLSMPSPRTTIAGAIHVHTTRSDGAGSVDDVAAAAARAGLQFVVVTDHGNGQRAPIAPDYRSGVLLIDGVEIGTDGGHYLAIGMQRPPYPLGGAARDVVEDVTRLGGLGIVPHGDAPDPDSRWADWTHEIEGLEWLNLSTVWERASGMQLARASIGYWFRPRETLALAMARPAALDRLDAIGGARRIVTFAATDAHGTLPRSYEACFRAVSTQVQLEAPLTRRPSHDAHAVIAALRAGRHYSVVDALSSGGALEFHGRRGHTLVRMGEAVSSGGPLTLEARVAATPGVMLQVRRNGTVVHQTSRSEIVYEAGTHPAAYRVEAHLAQAPGEPPIPWIVSNPIFVGVPARRASAVPAPPTAALDVTSPRHARWHAEMSDGSSATIAAAPGDPAGLSMRFALRGGPPRDQFAGIVLPVPDDFAAYDRVTIEGRASAPMRLSVQLREVGNRNPPRWRRSVYLDDTPRAATIFFEEMAPVPPEILPVPSLRSIGGLLLLLDTTNTSPGTSGEIRFRRITFQR